MLKALPGAEELTRRVKLPPEYMDAARELRELLEKRFLWAKDPVSFWVNPSLFFKGDRVLFIKEYRRRKPSDLEELEAAGQHRLELERTT